MLDTQEAQGTTPRYTPKELDRKQLLRIIVCQAVANVKGVPVRTVNVTFPLGPHVDDVMGEMYRYGLLTTRAETTPGMTVACVLKLLN
jgi:hypothetical protein